MYSNPLRVLDTKNPAMQAMAEGAPKLLDFLGEASLAHFNGVKRAAGRPSAWPTAFNPRLVRGLDYYNLTVFEWVTDKLGAQGTVCAGGRYDGLVEQLGGKPTPAVGFGMGLERLLLLLETLGLQSPTRRPGCLRRRARSGRTAAHPADAGGAARGRRGRADARRWRLVQVSVQEGRRLRRALSRWCSAPTNWRAVKSAVKPLRDGAEQTSRPARRRGRLGGRTAHRIIPGLVRAALAVSAFSWHRISTSKNKNNLTSSRPSGSAGAT